MKKIHTTGRPFCRLADDSKLIFYKSHSSHYDRIAVNTAKHTATTNAWQSLAYSLLSVIVSPPSKYL